MEIVYDSNGNPFAFPRLILDEREVSKVFHEINNLYHSKYKGKRFAMHRTLDLQSNYCIYYFENHGFNDYNIVEKYFD